MHCSVKQTIFFIFESRDKYTLWRKADSRGEFCLCLMWKILQTICRFAAAQENTGSKPWGVLGRDVHFNPLKKGRSCPVWDCLFYLSCSLFPSCFIHPTFRLPPVFVSPEISLHLSCVCSVLSVVCLLTLDYHFPTDGLTLSWAKTLCKGLLLLKCSSYFTILKLNATKLRNLFIYLLFPRKHFSHKVLIKVVNSFMQNTDFISTSLMCPRGRGRSYHSTQQ